MPEITETFFAQDRVLWRAWLEEHHADQREIWLIFLKKHVPEPCVSLDEAVEEALCFGWVDSQLRRIDDRSHVLRFTPRRPGSVWAASNKARVERLIAAGQMTAAGLAAVEEAKRNGDWDRLPADAVLDEAPDDLARALEADATARRTFGALPPSHRRQYVYWVIEAKRPETRARRVAEVVRRVAAGIRPGEPG